MLLFTTQTKDGRFLNKNLHICTPGEDSPGVFTQIEVDNLIKNNQSDEPIFGKIVGIRTTVRVVKERENTIRPKRAEIEIRHIFFGEQLFLVGVLKHWGFPQASMCFALNEEDTLEREYRSMVTALCRKAFGYKKSFKRQGGTKNINERPVIPHYNPSQWIIKDNGNFKYVRRGTYLI